MTVHVAHPLARRAAAALAALGLVAGLTAGLLPGAMAASSTASPLADDVAGAAPGASTVRLVKVADVPKPVLAISPPDGTDRLFIVSQAGRIRIVKNGSLLPTPFLDISAGVSTGGERGLLGLAFHPSFSSNRRFYVNYTNRDGDTVIREYKASAGDPDRVEAGSGKTILRIAQPYANHNGGMIAFGPDHLLYIGMGDGGSAGDPGNRAQSIHTLLGKMLRINVNGSVGSRPYKIPASNPYANRAGRDEIWQRGLRNPWRFSFDRATGNLWIGDVGQNRYEEVDRAYRTSSGAGKGFNWGWRVMEGRHCYQPLHGCNTSSKKLPLVEYSHAANGRCALTGGYVYRGTAIPALRGWYVYGDFCSGEVWAVSSGAKMPAAAVRLLGTGSGRLVSGFGETAAGELLLCDLNGTVYRIEAN
jgi:glucose/arabinose dehydrogenase